MQGPHGEHRLSWPKSWPMIIAVARILCGPKSGLAVDETDMAVDENDSSGALVDLNKALLESGMAAEYREGQVEALASVLSATSTLVVMPTGSGKSLLYQLPAYILSRLPTSGPCITLVISPTISLMEDQVRNLPSCLRGACISSQRDNIQEVVQELCAGNVDILFVTPERLQSQTFVNFLTSGQCPPVKLACIDEAHCLSEWSHNFRPAFLHLDRALREKLDVPVILALTGTATKEARRDICKMLKLSRTIDHSAVRPNLRLSVSREDDRDVAIFNLLRSHPWKDMNSVIIYCMRRDQCDSLASYLRARNFQADSYHAGRTPDERHIIQSSFFTGRIKILVATVAYGMGINKSDIRGIIHHSLPKSLENYVQEIGRAGRDGLPASCHLFLSREDYVKLRSFAFSDAPYKAAVESLVEAAFGDRRPRGKGKGKQLSGTSSDGRKVAISVETIENEMDLKKEVAATLLTYMELQRPDLVRVMPIGHARCTVRFLKTSKEELAERDEIVSSILRNVDDVDSSQPMVFDVLDVCQDLGIGVSDLRAKLRSLKSQKELAFEFVKDAFLLQVQTPSDADKQALVAELCAEVVRLEKIRVQKVDDIYQALLPVAFSTFADSALREPGDEDEDEDEALTAEGADSSETLKQALHDYFSSGAGDESPQNPKQVSRWGFVDPMLVERQKQEYADMNTNIRVFIWRKSGKFPSGRVVARILHGLESPKYRAADWLVESMFCGRVLIPVACRSHEQLWGKGKHFNFRELERMAEDSLKRFSESQGKSKSKADAESDSDSEQ
ncbi:P-loop containing nucleoside triphosphate hydrolase protein [Hyaloraphidium curvatum]|nr:P-loop containing nucleoside triphosphate hydrolase protein [Hyaloraphidium curvatum]